MPNHTRSQLASDVVVHRIGGRGVANLRLKAKEETLSPPGISVFVGGLPEDAAEQLRDAFPNAERLRAATERVASATVASIRQVGFDLIADPTLRFVSHARLIHPDGASGFSDANLTALSNVLTDTEVE